jgi:hypothetical protein
MGSNAFLYYFPVIDEYLRSAIRTHNGDDCQAGILGSCVAAQFDWKGAHIRPELRLRIKALCDYVLRNLSRFACSPDDEERIKDRWLQVQEKINEET